MVREGKTGGKKKQKKTTEVNFDPQELTKKVLKNEVKTDVQSAE